MEILGQWISQAAWVAAGAMIGAPLRFLMLQMATAWGAPYSLGPNLAPNVLGCFLFGVFSAFSWSKMPQAYLMLSIGLCGSLTTFSGFVSELQQLPCITNGPPQLFYFRFICFSVYWHLF